MFHFLSLCTSRPHPPQECALFSVRTFFFVWCFQIIFGGTLNVVQNAAKKQQYWRKSLVELCWPLETCTRRMLRIWAARGAAPVLRTKLWQTFRLQRRNTHYPTLKQIRFCVYNAQNLRHVTCVSRICHRCRTSCYQGGRCQSCSPEKTTEWNLFLIIATRSKCLLAVCDTERQNSSVSTSYHMTCSWMYLRVSSCVATRPWGDNMVPLGHGWEMAIDDGVTPGTMISKRTFQVISGGCTTDLQAASTESIWTPVSCSFWICLGEELSARNMWSLNF